MTAGWVAASTRGRALVGRLVGTDGAQELAAAETWPDARRHLESTFYGLTLSSGADRAEGRRAAAEATMWQLRVLAGWLPVGGSGLARLFAAPFEIANIESHLDAIAGSIRVEPVALGSLATAWRRIAATTSASQVRTELRHSTWGDPGGTDRAAIALGLRLSWARRLVSGLPAATAHGQGGAAVLLARERFAFGREIVPATGKQFDRMFGRRWRSAITLPNLVEILPDSASWPFADSPTPEELWRAEAAVIRRAESDASRIAGDGHSTKATVAAVMALMLIDLWRVTAAIELAGRSPDPIEVFDAVA